jgi:hypothetical protein
MVTLLIGLAAVSWDTSELWVGAERKSRLSRAARATNPMKGRTCEKAAENGDFGCCFRRPFHRTPTRLLALAPSFDGFEPLRRNLTYLKLERPWSFI